MFHILLQTFFFPWLCKLPDISSSFRRFDQEDAHEFLQCFLDRLESSCTVSKTKDMTMSLSDDNFVKQGFGGRLVSKVRIQDFPIYIWFFNFIILIVLVIFLETNFVLWWILIIVLHNNLYSFKISYSLSSKLTVRLDCQEGQKGKDYV